MTTDTPATVRVWYVAVYLRNNADPVLVPQESKDAALASVGYVALTWLRFPPEARPASCWLVTRAGVETVVNDEGVANATKHEILAVFDPREIAAVRAFPHDVEAWKAAA